MSEYKRLGSPLVVDSSSQIFAAHEIFGGISGIFSRKKRNEVEAE